VGDRPWENAEVDGRHEGAGRQRGKRLPGGARERGQHERAGPDRAGGQGQLSVMAQQRLLEDEVARQPKGSAQDCERAEVEAKPPTLPGGDDCGA
jgi:hypothetical protein